MMFWKREYQLASSILPASSEVCGSCRQVPKRMLVFLLGYEVCG